MWLLCFLIVIIIYYYSLVQVICFNVFPARLLELIVISPSLFGRWVPLNVMEILKFPAEGSPELKQAMQRLTDLGVLELKSTLRSGKRGDSINIAIFDSPESAQGLASAMFAVHIVHTTKQPCQRHFVIDRYGHSLKWVVLNCNCFCKALFFLF